MPVNRFFGVLLLIFFCGGPLAAQRSFTLELQGGLSVGGLRDEMYAPLNYARTGFGVGLGGEYRFGKSQVEIALDFGRGKGKTGVSDYFGTDYYAVGIAGSYLRNVWKPTPALSLWCGGSYRFGVNGLVWQRKSYAYVGSHAFSPRLRLEWEAAPRHRFSTELSFYLLGWVMRPPYNYLPNFGGETQRSYWWYLMRQLRAADFALIGHHWDIGWAASYHYRITPRLGLGLRYAFRYLRYPDPQPCIHYDHQLMISAKIRL